MLNTAQSMSSGTISLLQLAVLVLFTVKFLVRIKKKYVIFRVDNNINMSDDIVKRLFFSTYI